MLAIVGASLTSGCEVGNVFSREDAFVGDAESEPGGDELLEEGLVAYLDVMRTLVEGDVLTQTETFQQVAQEAAASPTTTNRVKHALAVATPGHPNEDPAEAQQRLSRLLAAGAALLPEERMLVAIHLKEVEQRLILDAETRRLREEARAALAAQDDESTERLQAALAENERLTEELQEAQQKLDAITNIERSIRERENGANP